MRKICLFLSLWFITFVTRAQVKTPAQLYPELFKAVQMERVYGDGKTFPDAVPLADAATINREYTQQKNKSDFDLKAFTKKYFREPYINADVFKTDPSKGVYQHIDTLWSVLRRHADTAANTSLIPLPHSYIVPGGRFREVYYWDSYFTMLGLQQAKKYETIRDMVKNFAWLIDNYGHIPNGNRTYYLSRSQPPFFAMMVRLLAEIDGKEVLTTYLPQMLKEYNFWMDGAAKIKSGSAYRRLLRMPGGELLNRYWDDSDQPREESYREDVLAARESKQAPAAFYRNIRAAAESGWDFSSRWFADGKTLQTIITTDIVPVDLNCLLYNLESTIARGYQLKGNQSAYNKYIALAKQRRVAIQKYCWNGNKGAFVDYNWRERRSSSQLTIATSFPLLFNIATPRQAKSISAVIGRQFLFAGGVATTLKTTGQQWDRPNGWAPLQYITIAGLRNYQQKALAAEIATHWIKHNRLAYKQTGKLLEKYNIELKGDAAKAGGGEYPLQDGFGWTNGVLLKLMSLYK